MCTLKADPNRKLQDYTFQLRAHTFFQIVYSWLIFLISGWERKLTLLKLSFDDWAHDWKSHNFICLLSFWSYLNVQNAYTGANTEYKPQSRVWDNQTCCMLWSLPIVSAQGAQLCLSIIHPSNHPPIHLASCSIRWMDGRLDVCMHACMDRQTDRQTNRQTDRLTDWPTDRLTRIDR